MTLAPLRRGSYLALRGSSQRAARKEDVSGLAFGDALPMPASTARLAVITGAGRGIGRRIAEKLALNGWVVGLIDRAGLADTLQSILGEGGEATAFTCDVSE